MLWPFNTNAMGTVEMVGFKGCSSQGIQRTLSLQTPRLRDLLTMPLIASSTARCCMISAWSRHQSLSGGWSARAWSWARWNTHCTG